MNSKIKSILKFTGLWIAVIIMFLVIGLVVSGAMMMLKHFVPSIELPIGILAVVALSGYLARIIWYAL